MATLEQQMAAFNRASKAQFGNDIKVFVARSPAFGDKDCCVIFHGQNQVAAAKAFNLKAKGILRTEAKEMLGEEMKSTTVTFNA
jgi:hypothetical protein